MAGPLPCFIAPGCRGLFMKNVVFALVLESSTRSWVSQGGGRRVFPPCNMGAHANCEHTKSTPPLRHYGMRISRLSPGPSCPIMTLSDQESMHAVVVGRSPLRASKVAVTSVQITT